MHVTADAVNHGGLVQDVYPFHGRDPVGRDDDVRMAVEAPSSVHRSKTQPRRVRSRAAPKRDVALAEVLGLVALGVEPDGHHQGGVDVVFVGVVVRVPVDLRSRPDQATLVRWEDPPLRADAGIDEMVPSHGVPVRILGQNEAGG